MTALLARLLGRLPIGWLQLTHSRMRMAAALAGVAFANVLVFVQLGMMGALNGTVEMTYAPVRGDIIISSIDANTLTDGSPLSRRVLFLALADPEVAAATPFYLAKVDWTREDGSTASLNVYALQAEAARFAGPDIVGPLHTLALPDSALIDQRTRGADSSALARITPEAPLRFEANGHTITATGSFALGGGFSADGAIVVSDQTFLRLFSSRIAGTPTHVLVDVTAGANADAVAARLSDRLAGEAVQVRTMAMAQAADLSYQTTQRPTGVIFGFGVAMGVLIGLVIVYQVLSTDVADHLREYATFKAMGYPHQFFLSIVFEEAAILGAMGFVPGIILSIGIYAAMAQATGLPVAMTPVRAAMVFFGTVLACAASGALATRRLRAADPAELF
jgi:putative ABC transport system permease protein